MGENNIGQMDIIDRQSFSSEAEGTAKRLVQEHGNNFEAIEKEVKKMMVPKDKDFVEEILWAVRWMLLTA